MEVLEALAARRAAKFVVELAYRLLKAADGAHSAMGVIIKDTMSIIGSLRTFSFSHT